MVCLPGDKIEAITEINIVGSGNGGSVLVLKLKAHGIFKDVIDWIEKWLTHRRQRVK